MKALTEQQKAEIEAVTAAYAASLKTHPTKGKHEFKTNQSNFSSVNFSAVAEFHAPPVRFSAEVEDVGNESFSFLNDEQFDFAAFNRAAKAESGIQAIKRIVATHNVRESVKTYLTSRNDVIRRNKARKAEANKLTKKTDFSTPFGV